MKLTEKEYRMLLCALDCYVFDLKSDEEHFVTVESYYDLFEKIEQMSKGELCHEVE